jgi:competence ComEA-like helix-hairpin-helix protein
MTQRERRSLLLGCLLLLIAGVVRTLAVAETADTLTSPSDALPELLDESLAAAEEADLRRRPLGGDERIDVNRAGEVDLDRLPGIGPSTARAIVAFREENGAFRSAQDLERVRGIGQATVSRLEPWLDFSLGIPRVLARRRGPSESPPLVSLRSASATDLERLPGIGPALAARIIEARDRRGYFSSWEDLLAVRGIGPRKLDALRDVARLDG